MNPPAKRFEGKHAFVTGAGSGIGRAIAVRLAASAAQETADLILRAGGQAEPVACDVADSAAMGRVIGACARLDVLVTSAGIAHIG